MANSRTKESSSTGRSRDGLDVVTTRGGEDA